MTEREMETIIRDMVEEVTGITNFTMDTEFVKDMAMNSMDIANLVCGCEDEFDIEIPMKDIRDFVRVRDAMEYMKKKVFG